MSKKDTEKEIAARLFQNKEELSSEVKKKLEAFLFSDALDKKIEPLKKEEPEDPLLNLLKEKALVFQEGSLEYDLWRRFSEFPSRRDSDLLFWYAVSKCHLYLCLNQLDDKILWECRSILLKENTIFSWSTLLHSMIEAIKKKHQPQDKEWKEKVLSQLKVLDELDYVSAKDIQDYIVKNDIFNPKTLSRAQQHLEFLGDFPKLEFLVFEKILSTSRLTNRDLFRILKLCKILNQKDMGWLAATILHARKVLPKDMVKIWEFSGEHRKEYPLLVPTEKDMECCFFDFSEEDKELVKHCFHVSSFYKEKINPFNILNFSRKKSLFEKNMDTVFKKTEGLHWHRTSLLKKLFYKDSIELLPMAQVTVKNHWSLLLGKMICRMGLHHWHWNIFHLLDSFHVNEWALPQNKAKSTKKDVRHLASLQISSLTSLKQLCREKSREDVCQLLAIFLCRLTFLIFPSHYVALTSLQEMEMPFDMIKKVENFLLSKPYLEYRAKRGLGHLVFLEEFF